ncbi:hypothetical protein [Halorubrum sp. GN11GM_10-3_MGM]|uniref:DUF7562 family protein n=1 Tax=Halorubrum sp. GN11GM_10-3_MGM TaxID=2518111 RepID=UPI0010F5769F|nr:hypothetical protein [Halorubrum sp. GN11GM_10-3_MGM]TKX72721.1 hypothetical protein EXE40_03115 [Halorubrum sp. GN11GM_10-3_MGM]
MWRSRESRDRRTVVCIACGDSVLREDAREYDKEGDRWNRREKEFEYLCADCDDEISHQPRDGLESLILSIESDGLTTEEFLDRYADAVEDDDDGTGEDGAGGRSDRGRSDRTRSDRDRDR